MNSFSKYQKLRVLRYDTEDPDTFEDEQRYGVFECYYDHKDHLVGVSEHLTLYSCGSREDLIEMLERTLKEIQEPSDVKAYDDIPFIRDL